MRRSSPAPAFFLRHRRRVDHVFQPSTSNDVARCIIIDKFLNFGKLRGMLAKMTHEGIVPLLNSALRKRFSIEGNHLAVVEHELHRHAEDIMLSQRRYAPAV